MDFVYKIDTPTTTSADDPKVTIAKITRGRLVGGFLFFPSGPAGTLNFLARIGVHQILPFNVGQSYALDDCIVPIHFGIDLPEPPFQIDFITWNTSTLYTHTLTVGLFLDPMMKKGWKILDAIKDLNPIKGNKKE